MSHTEGHLNYLPGWHVISERVEKKEWINQFWEKCSNKMSNGWSHHKGVNFFVLRQRRPETATSREGTWSGVQLVSKYEAVLEWWLGEYSNFSS